MKKQGAKRMAHGVRIVVFALCSLLYAASSPAQPTNQGHDGFWQCFRVTTESGVPVSTSDRTAQSTIYATPYGCDKMSIYSGLGNEWETVRSPEFSLALSGLTSGKNYDVFAYRCALALCLELSAAWTNDTTRADALATQNGRQVKSADKTRLFIATIRTTGTTTTEDSGGGTTTQVGGKRFIWNAYNQVRRHITVFDSTDSWNYTTSTIRQANGATGNKVEYVVGDSASLIQAQLIVAVFGVSQGTANYVGIGVNSTTTFSGRRGIARNELGGGVEQTHKAEYFGYPGLGYNSISWNEEGSGSTYFLGDNNARASSGLTVILWN